MDDGQLEVTIDEGDELVVRLVGEVDVANVAELDVALNDAAGRVPAHGVLAVDLSGLGFIDSAGLGALVRLHKRLDEASCHLVLRQPPTHIRRVLDIGGLSAVLAIE